MMLTSDKATLKELNVALQNAAAVIIYRASPKQKQQVVQFIKEHNPGKITLSVGDGSNDVNMIQAAHVGIGIMGKEGNQAASFSDYSISEFRSLRKLVLWHGRQFGQGSGDFLCTNLFKSVAFSMSLSTYNFYAGFSGLQPIDSVFWLGYNLVITTIQMGFTFVMDQDAPMIHAAKVVNRNALLDNYNARKHGQPVLPTEDKAKDIYAEESQNLRYNIADYYLFSKVYYQLPLIYRTFIWEVLAVCSGLICFYIPFYVYGYGVANHSGRTEDLFSIYFASYQANILTHHLQMFVTIRNYTKVFAISSVVSMSMLWPITILLCNYELAPSENLNHHLGEIIFDQFFYQASSVIIATAIVIIPIYAFKVLKMRFKFPQFFPQNQSI